MLKFALAIIFVFAASVAAMAWWQEQLLFPTHAVSPTEPLPGAARRISTATADGVRLSGVHIPPASGTSGATTLVLGFGGNGWDADDVASYLHRLYPQANVVAFHYRGYRPSEGRPTAQALIDDSPKVLDRALDQVKPKRTVAVGFSIGSAVAAALAKDARVNGLVLVTPFDSLKSVAAELYPWLPVNLLFRNEMNALEQLRASRTPVAIVAAGSDEIIPAKRTRALGEKVPNLIFERTIAGAGHNDIYARADFQEAMREAMEKVAG